VWSGATDDNWDIYVKALGVGAAFLRLTRNAANDTVPAWSPDGRHIAFVRELGEGVAMYTGPSANQPKKTAIFSVPSLNGPERKLTDIPHPEQKFQTGALFGLQRSLS
jgi:Tol biopolymer transport system component